MNEMKIDTIADILALSPEQFGRFVPDLAAYFVFAKEAEKIGGTVSGMIWVDDNKPGQIHSVRVVDTDGNSIATVNGPAFPSKAGA